MKNGIYEIVSNRPIALDTYEMVLAGDMGFVENPGQFVNIQLEGLYLRRPISICDWDDRTMTLIYKVVGRGTRQMAAMAPGHKLDLLTGLGNGFSMEEAGEHSLVIGGGVGVPPLYGLCKRLVQQGKRVSAVLGFGKQEQVFYQKEFEELGCPVYLATEDGSLGTKGNVLDAVRENGLQGDVIFACGPTPMLRAIKEYALEHEMTCYISMEEKMACGIGACLACVCKSKEVDHHSNVKNKRICKDGPVFLSTEVEL